MGYYGYIYKTTNLINGKIYIGQRKGNIEKSKGYYGSGIIFKKAIKKYGKNSFIKEILCTCKDLDESNKKEIYFIKYYKDQNYSLYNIENGGNCKGKFSKEQLIKMSDNHTGEKSFFYGRRGREALNYGKKVPMEIRKKISESNKGEKAYLFSKKGELNHISKPVYQIDIKSNIILKKWSSSAEVKRKLKIGHVDEVCNGKRKTAGGFFWKHVEENEIKTVTKKIMQIDMKTNEIIKIWGSSTIAAPYINISQSNISAVCNKRQKTAGGFKWEYVK